MRTVETDSRIVIDRLLREAGWSIEDKSQVSTEEPAADGRADYLLLDSRSRPLAVIEAKKFSVNPNLAQEQAKEYAKSIDAPFIFLSNGETIFFWDYKNSNARQIDSFYGRDDLERRNVLSKQSKPLEEIPIPENFYHFNKDIRVRPYQKEAVLAVDKAISKGKRRMLIEMATGTGKTLTIAIILKRLFEAGLTQKVLFLVDRKNLAEQAKEVLAEYLKGYEPKVWYGGKPKELGRIVIGTLPTIASQLERFSPGHFDVVITDECHRSIYNIYRDLLNHFDALQIGLTATPNLGHYEYFNEKEKKLVRNTYEFYDCWNHASKSGEPTFAYDIVGGIKDGFLAKYNIYLAKTRITVQGVNYDGVDYKPSDLERKITIRSRNRLMVEEFRLHETQLGGTHPRKTLVFAVTKNHAAQLKEHFDAVFPEYKGEYAKIITSDTQNSDQILADFKKQAFPICLISVGMLDTGIDAPSVENIVMMRPTVSAILYQQIRGRGSRLDPNINKTSFLVYDFVDNASRFNDPMLADAIPGEKFLPSDFSKQVEEARKRKPFDFIIVPESEVSDEITSRETINVGPEGMAIDRKTYTEKFVETVKSMKTEPVVQKILGDKVLTSEEIQKLIEKLNSPEYYFNQENLQEAYKEPTGSVVDFIKAVFDKYKFPTKKERIEDVYSSWLRQKNFTPQQTRLLAQLRDRFVAGDEKIDAEDFTKPPFSDQGGLQLAISLFGEENLIEVLDELSETIFI
ncbi:MAG TPA: DEAD/DEAH box helicase family protein [Patescibacteria group bacterium]|nr:DEAD/DEAH box helicase family protein [Patescibacteria group bacterium]